MTTREKIEQALDTLPTLTAYGVGIFEHGRGLSMQEAQKEVAKKKDILLSDTADFEKICTWLEAIQKTPTINLNYTSYDLKHIAERQVGYATNGTFIAAAIYSGFAFETAVGSPNVAFGMSEKSLKMKQLLSR